MQNEGNPTILVVDDEPDVRSLVAAIIGSLGYQVLTAESGEHALALHQKPETHIDLLVADVVPKGMSGPALAEKLTACQPDLKVLYISGYDRSHVVQKYVLDRGFTLLSKPFTVSQLADAVNTLLARKPQVRAAV
ncbi:MAG TPA: response regulator [Candidatus Acidoferrales bacterium]|nr:response regulator [Candidatus Acidoferrales bacterium]